MEPVLDQIDRDPATLRRVTYTPAPSPAAVATPRPSKWRSIGVVPVVVIVVLLLGAIAQLVMGRPQLAQGLWLAGLLGAGFPVVWRTLRSAMRGKFNTDLVASLSIVTAAIIGQPLAGLVIVLMQTGGEALERYAERRASTAVSELEKAAPRIAHLVTTTSGLVDVPVNDLGIGDIFLVRPGEMIPCDGVIVNGSSEIDTSQLTGEAVPVSAQAGASVMSGSLNMHGVLSIRATALAADSQYSRIVELVRLAQASKSPLQRLADRYAVWFTPATLGVCGITYAMTGSWVNVLSVLVVATPCPLILATPVAIIGGINRAARRKIIIRNGGALENLSRARTGVFDKTGTLTVGKPRVDKVTALAGFTEDEVLRFAAAVENGSSHLLARVVVDEATSVFGSVLPATRYRESPGQGVEGVVQGIEVVVGGQGFVALRATSPVDAFLDADGDDVGLRAYVLINGTPAGVIDYADSVRPELARSLAALRQQGFARTVLLSGDRATNATAIGRLAGISEIHGDLLPAQKASLVAKYRAAGDVVMMVGDGTNDAPALSAADVGVALAGHGGGVTSEAADVVILIDDLSRVAEAVAISRRTMRLARQSIGVGLALSGVAMVFAAAGHIAPTQGAVLQEAIDIGVILNALRASWS